MNESPQGSLSHIQIVHSKYAMKKSVRIMCLLIIGITILSTLTLHLLISAENNQLQDMDATIAQTDASIEKIKKDAPFMAYKRNGEFLNTLSIVQISPYLKEIFSLTQAPFSLTGTQLAYMGSGKNVSDLSGKISVAGPEDMSLASAYLSKLKDSIYFSLPYIPAIANSKNSDGTSQYSFPITLQLTRFNNAPKK